MRIICITISRNAYKGALELAISGDAAGWQAHVVPIGSSGQQMRFNAMAAYASQMPTEDMAVAEKQLADYVRLVGGERIWRKVNCRRKASSRGL